jgi:carbon-monoxide dehydrogenase medium subunit
MFSVFLIRPLMDARADIRPGAHPVWSIRDFGGYDGVVRRPSAKRAAMKLPPFEYRCPKTVQETVELLVEHGDEAKVLAGGQSLLPMLAMRLARPAVLIDINRVAGLSDIRVNGEVAIGALTRHRTAERSEALASAAPLLAAALRWVGHDAIRTRGTVGGSVAHADPAAEAPTVLRALDGHVVATSVRGQRTIDAESFLQGFLTTSLEPDELVTEVRLPIQPQRTGWSFDEFSRRSGDFALVGAATVVSLGADGMIAAARVALSGVAGVPYRAVSAEASLIGAAPSDAIFAEAAALAAADVDPPSDLHGTAAYRKHLAGVLVRRGLKNASSLAMGRS